MEITPTPITLPHISPIATNVENFLAMAEKYGLSVVMLALAIVALVVVSMWLSKKFDAMVEDQRKRNDEMFKMLVEVRENVPDTRKEGVEKLSRLNMAIYSLLREIMTVYGPNWVHFYQFHNGSKVVGAFRIPFMYISMTHELVSEGVTPVQEEFTQLSLSLVNNMVRVLIDNPLLVQKANPTNQADNPITARMFELGTQSQDLLSVRDMSGSLVAVIELDWLVAPDLDDAKRSSLREYAGRMGNVLASYDEDAPNVTGRKMIIGKTVIQ